jgi:multidrug efflux pump subunit AcrB
MNPAEFTIQNKLLAALVILITLGAGWSAYQTMPRFEDPEFTIRTAIVSVTYPGASPQEVAEEVVKPLETAIQQLQEVDSINSTVKAGRAELSVDIKYAFSKNRADLQMVWTKLRNKIADAKNRLPPETGPVSVNDDFGDVYGFIYLITGDGFSPNDLRRYAESLRDDVLQIENVAKVAILGTRQEAIFLEVSQSAVDRMGIAVEKVMGQLSQQNTVSSSGDLVVGGRRLLLTPTGKLDSVDALKSLPVGRGAGGGLVYLGDIASISRGYREPVGQIIRYKGQPALAFGISAVLGTNVVEVGAAIEKALAESVSRRPLGIELHEYYQQGTVVDASIRNFVVNVVAALVIVILTLLIFMGLRSAVVIGLILLLTVAATLAIMNASGIPMHRISLGALIIALGMMVDNAIVVTEGILVGVQAGRKRLEVAAEVVKQTIWPLLGGTLVGVLAFAPIGFAPGSTAEYTNHLFWVILISLLCSWVFAITLTPLFCFLGFSSMEKPGPATGKTVKATPSASLYERVMTVALSHRRWVMAATLLVFAASLWAFQFVKQSFFPASTTPQMVVDYWLPEGTDISKTEADAKTVESYLLEQPGVKGVQTLIGAGGLRFMLVYGPESANPAYAQFLIQLDDYTRANTLIPQVQNHLDQNYPEAQAKAWRFSLGPGGGSKIEAEFSGPDPLVLRKLATEARSVMIADGKALSIKTDWRDPVSYLEASFSHNRAQRAGLTRSDFSNAMLTHFNGRNVGLYRDGDELIPILMRSPAAERQNVDSIQDVKVVSPVTGKAVPASELTDNLQFAWREGTLKRENRIWRIKVQCDPESGELASTLRERLRPGIESIPLPDGYAFEWGGEFGDSSESQNDLASTLPLGFLSMVLVVVVLFNRIRQPLVIWLVVPLCLIGVVIGLVSTGIPLDFMGILGLLSLSGLLIKNAIVLVDQMDLETRSANDRSSALIHAASSRVRPVMMGTLTTVLGVIPLFFDAFFQAMAAVLVFGLSFATLLTLIVVPTLYAIFFRIPNPAPFRK